MGNEDKVFFVTIFWFSFAFCSFLILFMKFNLKHTHMKWKKKKEKNNKNEILSEQEIDKIIQLISGRRTSRMSIILQ